MLASVSDNFKIWNFQQETAGNVPENRESSFSRASLELQVNYRHPVEHFYSVAWNHTNQVLAIGGREPIIHLISSEKGSLLQSLTISESNFKSTKIQALDFSSNSRYLITSAHTPIQLWDLKAKRVKSVFTGHQHALVSLLFHAQNEYFFSADELGQIWIWNIKNQTIHHKFMDLTASIDKKAPDNNYLSCMKLSSVAGNYVASGYVDGSIKIWDASIGESNTGNNIVRKQILHSDKVTGVSFSPRNPNIIVSVGLDEQLHLLDIHSKPTEINLSVDVNQKLTSVSFHENGVNCAVGTMEGNIFIYDFRNTRYPIAQSIAHSPYPVNALAFQVPIDVNRLARKLKASTSMPDVRNPSEEKKELVAAPAVAPATANTVFSSATRSPKPSPSSVPSQVDNRSNRHDDGLKPPVLVTSIDFSNEKGKLNPSTESTAHHVEPDAAGEPAIHPVSLPGHISSELSDPLEDKNFSKKKQSSTPFHNSRLMLQASPKQIQETIKEIYPPISTDSLLQSATKINLSKEGRSLEDTKAQLRANISKSLLESSKSKAPDIPADDAVHQSYEEREKQYREQISQYYERNPSQKPSFHTNQSEGDIYSVHDDFTTLRQAIKPVTTKELEESLEVLKYEIHCEVQEIIHEQVRQFNIAKEETSLLFQELAKQLQELVRQNKELREENDYLRKIY